MSEDKLSYDPSKAPSPNTNPDWYAYATLVELRAIRQALQALVAQKEPLAVSLKATSTAKK